MITRDLMSKFERVQNLPVSEEMIGAYLENNLSDWESSDISNAIENDVLLMNITHDLINDSEIPDEIYEAPMIDYPLSQVFIEESTTYDLENIMSEDWINDNAYTPECDDCQLPDIENFISECDLFGTDINE